MKIEYHNSICISNDKENKIVPYKIGIPYSNLNIKSYKLKLYQERVKKKKLSPNTVYWVEIPNVTYCAIILCIFILLNNKSPNITGAIMLN